MAFFDNLVAREAGQPQAPAVPGAGPTASAPTSFVNPPAPSHGPPGRPPRPVQPFPGGVGAPLPLGPSPVSTGAVSRPPQAPKPASVAPRPQSKVEAPPPTAAGPFQVQMDRVPTRGELSQLPPGVQVATPYGTVGSDGQLQLSPEGRVLHQQALQKKLQEWGPSPFAGDPNAPKPNIRLGKPAVNPFTGRWTRG